MAHLRKTFLSGLLILISVSTCAEAKTKVATRPIPRRRIVRRVVQQQAAFHRFEVKVAPFTLLMSWWSLEGSYRITPHFATGPMIIAYKAGTKGNMFLPSYNGYAAGWQANYYLNSVSRPGAYTSAHIYYEDYTAYPHDNMDHYHHQGMRMNANLGFQFKLSSSFNLLAGAGPEFVLHQVRESGPLAPSDGTEFSTLQQFGLNLELKVGFEF